MPTDKPNPPSAWAYEPPSGEVRKEAYRLVHRILAEEHKTYQIDIAGWALTEHADARERKVLEYVSVNLTAIAAAWDHASASCARLDPENAACKLFAEAMAENAQGLREIISELDNQQKEPR